MIRLARLEDVAGLVEVNHEVHQLHLAARPDRYRDPTPEAVAAQLAAQLADPELTVLVAEEAGAILGYVVGGDPRRAGLQRAGAAVLRGPRLRDVRVPDGARGRMMRRLAAVLVIAACGGSTPEPAAPEPVGTTIENEGSPPAPDAGGRGWSRVEAAWDPDERDWIAAMLRELREVGERDGFPTLVELVERVTVVVREAAEGWITKQQLLEGFHAAEQHMTDPIDRRTQEMLDDLREAMRRVRSVR